MRAPIFCAPQARTFSAQNFPTICSSYLPELRLDDRELNGVIQSYPMRKKRIWKIFFSHCQSTEKKETEIGRFKRYLFVCCLPSVWARLFRMSKYWMKTHKARLHRCPFAQLNLQLTIYFALAFLFVLLFSYISIT